MALNANVLSFVGGAAEQITKNKDEFKKELRENKRRQRDWMNTYGHKVLNETKQKEEAITAALKQLESRGLQKPDVLQLMQRHGVEAVLDLQKYIKEYEDKSGNRVDSDLMNKIWESAEDFKTTSDTYEEAVSKVFGTYKVASAAPVIQEAEDKSFFDKLKANLSGAYEDAKYADFLDDRTEGIGNQSINDLRRMAAASPSMLGTEGAAVFDRSVLRGSESTSAERAAWKELKGTILSNALDSLDPTVADQIRVMQGVDSLNEISRSDDDQWNMLTATKAPEAYKEAIAEATRNAAQGIKLGENRAAWNSYGGQDALNAILNPLIALKEQLVENGLNDEDSQLIVDNPFVKTVNEQEDLAKVREFLEANPNLPYVIIDNKIMEAEGFLSRSEEGDGGGGGEEGSADTPEIPTQQSPVKPVNPRPAIKRGKGGNKDYKEWNKKYKGKYDPRTGAAIIVEKRPTVAPEPRHRQLQQTLEAVQTSWDRKYKDTHDAETGYPIGYVLINAEAGN